MTRIFDIVVSVIALVAFAPLLLVIALAIRIDSKGPALFWSQRFGARARLFKMPKFRTMRVGTPQVPTHLMLDGKANLTRIGGFLRSTSLDELPQFWSVLVGDMAIVGPRPALFNQEDLMELRRVAAVDKLRPGITGWAQINGRDGLELKDKVALEVEYLNRRSFNFNLRILFSTVSYVFSSKGISH